MLVRKVPLHSVKPGVLCVRCLWDMLKDKAYSNILILKII